MAGEELALARIHGEDRRGRRASAEQSIERCDRAGERAGPVSIGTMGGVDWLSHQPSPSAAL